MTAKKKGSSNEPEEFEKILATRTPPEGSPEYLVKLRNKSYRESKWFSGDALQCNPQASAMLTRFIKNQREYPTEPPYYNEQYDIIDRIIKKEGKKYLVKWMDLGYDQSTWEKEETIRTFPDSLNDYETRKLQHFPLKSGNIRNNPKIDYQKVISYNIGDIKLESYQISTMNLLLYNFSQMQSTEIVDRYNTQLSIPCAAFFQYLIQNNSNSAKPNQPKRRKTRNTEDIYLGEELGPLLIVAPLTSTTQWYHTFREIKECTTLNYTGSKENREFAYNEDFISSDDRLKFHVLITTPEILSKDSDILSEIQWRIAIFDEANRLKNPQSKLSKTLQRFVIGVQIALMQSQPSLFCLQKLTNLLLRAKNYFDEDTLNAVKEVQSRIQPKLSKRKNQQSLSFDDENDSYTTYYIDCPLSLTQRKVLRSIVQDQIKYVQKKNFLPLCQRILRICSHPFLLFSQEYMLNGVDLVLSSTKLGILEELLVSEQNSQILVVSDFSMMLDMVQDICNENRIYTERIVSQSKEILNQNANLFLYNPKLCEIASSIFERINVIIIIDGDDETIQQKIQSDKQRPPNLRKVYKLICRDCSETKLNSLCILNKSESPDVEQCESICKLSTLAAFSDKQVPEPKALIDKATVVSNSFNPNELLEKEFEQCDFWGSLFGEESTGTYENALVDINESEEHTWTKRERDQLLRGLRRFGVDRWKDLRMQTGLKVNVQNMIHASRALLREMLRILGTNSGHGVSREFIKENSELDDDEVADKAFINNTVFSDYEFALAIQNNASSYLREMEMIHYLGECIKDTSDVYEISLPHPTGKLPTWWTDNHDNYLAYATYKYGLGSYEQFVEDGNREIVKIFGPSDDQIPYSMLTERALKLAEAIKRKQGVTQLGLANANNEINEKPTNKKEANEANEQPTRRTTFQSPTDENYSANDGRRRDEGRDMFQFLLRYGVPEDSEGNPDYEAFGLQSGLINDGPNSKSVEQVQILVEDYLAKCNIPPEDGGIPPKTANRIKERCTAMKQLREMLRDEKVAPYVFSHAPRWRYLPDKWTPELEYDYFKQVCKIGLVNDQYQTIFQSDKYENLFKDNEPPNFILKDTNVMKRINNIYQSMIEGKNDGTLEKMMNAKSNKKSKPQTKSKETKKSAATETKKPSSKSKNKVPFGFIVQANHGLFPGDRALFKGRVNYPVNIGKGRYIENIGKIIPEREDFHNERYIFPVGYKVKNVLPSATEPDVETTWINEITVCQDLLGQRVVLDDPADHSEEELNDTSYHLLFRSWMESDPLKKYEGETPNAVWNLICKDISKVNDGKPYTISGMDAFLLTTRTMIYVVQHMEGAKRCHLYVAKEVDLPRDIQRLREWTQSQGPHFVFTPNSESEIVPEDRMVDMDAIRNFHAKPGPKPGFTKKNKNAKKEKETETEKEKETEYEYEYEEETEYEYEEERPEK